MNIIIIFCFLLNLILYALVSFPLPRRIDREYSLASLLTLALPCMNVASAAAEFASVAPEWG